MKNILLCKILNFYRNLSLQNIITLPFLVQIFVTVSLVGYFSWRNGEQAVNNVTSKLRREVTIGVEQHLKGYLQTPHLIVRLKQNSVKNQQLNVKNFLSVQQDFWSTIRLFDSVRAIYVGDKTGKFVYTKREQDKFYSQEVIDTPLRKTYLLDNLGQKKQLVETNKYDPRIRPWYINTQATQNNNWSKIYTFTGGELGITAAGLLEDSEGRIQGIVGVDLVLSGIGHFLKTIEVSKNGQVFILERNGYLVATSTDEEPFTFDPITNKEHRLRAIKSNNRLVAATTKHITEHFRSLDRLDRLQKFEFSLDNQNQLVQVVPYKDEFGLDWLIVVVLPEADFMAEIESNTHNTILFCLVALAIATCLGIYTSRKIAQPLSHLSQVTDIVANSAKARNASTRFYPIIKVKSIKELQSLATTFNEMVVQLKAAFKELENNNFTLEKRVAERTTALMNAKEAADAANRAKSQFLANMSHELRTPLHAILGFTQVALQDNSLTPLKRENLLIIKRSGEHLLALIDDVLEMSRIEAGSSSTVFKSFDLHLLLANSAKMFQLKASQKNIKLTFNIPSNIPQYIKTDPIKLNQILINLIDNGIKFTDRGEVTLNLKLFSEPQQTVLAFAIVDTGHGILPSQLETIFVPFTQTRQADIEGTGLGLSICQQFVNLLGGEITVSSKLGRGSLFKFYIPVEIVKPQNSTASKTARNFNQRSESHRFYSAIPKGDRIISDFTPIKRQKLAVCDLANMTTEWVEKLHQAAIAVDGDLILQLIAEIPTAETNLTATLTEMLEYFEYDEIVELTEQVIQRRA